MSVLAIENFPQGIRYLAERGWIVDEQDDDGTTRTLTLFALVPERQSSH